MMPTKLQELRSELAVKSQNFRKIFEQARVGEGDLDLLKADAFQHLSDPSHARELVQQMEKELDELNDKLVAAEHLHKMEEKARERYEAMNKVAEPHRHANGNGTNGASGLPALPMSLGQLVKKYWQPEQKGAFHREFPEWDIRMLGASEYELKTLFQRTAGWAPESTRIPRFIEYATRPIQLLDLFPIGNTTQALIKYMEETSFTNTAAEKAEGTASDEATLAETERSVTVQKIPVHISVTEEQLADVDQVADYLDARMTFMVRQRLDGQVLNGDGISPNILGIVNASPQSQARGADDTADAVYKAIVKVRVTGQASPSAILMHPTNFQTVRLARANGAYLWAHPSEVGPTRLWGLPVIEAQALSVGTAVVGDFVNFSQLWMRSGVEVQIGFTGTQFIEGKQTIRAFLRCAMAWYRPAAFCLVTGLN